METKVPSYLAQARAAIAQFASPASNWSDVASPELVAPPRRSKAPHSEARSSLRSSDDSGNYSDLLLSALDVAEKLQRHMLDTSGSQGSVSGTSRSGSDDHQSNHTSSAEGGGTHDESAPLLSQSTWLEQPHAPAHAERRLSQSSRASVASRGSRVDTLQSHHISGHATSPVAPSPTLKPLEQSSQVPPPMDPSFYNSIKNLAATVQARAKDLETTLHAQTTVTPLKAHIDILGDMREEIRKHSDNIAATKARIASDVTVSQPIQQTPVTPEKRLTMTATMTGLKTPEMVHLDTLIAKRKLRASSLLSREDLARLSRNPAVEIYRLIRVMEKALTATHTEMSSSSFVSQTDKSFEELRLYKQLIQAICNLVGVDANKADAELLPRISQFAVAAMSPSKPTSASTFTTPRTVSEIPAASSRPVSRATTPGTKPAPFSPATDVLSQAYRQIEESRTLLAQTRLIVHS